MKSIFLSLATLLLPVCTFSTLHSPLPVSSRAKIPKDWAERVARYDAFYCEDDTIPLGPEGYPDQLYLPLIGNGYFAHAKGVRADTYHISGIFNNETTSPSHRARIPATFAITIQEEMTYGAMIDIREGIYYRRGEISSEEGWYELRWYAHRSIRSLYVMELVMNLYDGVENVNLSLSNNRGADSEDIKFDKQYTIQGLSVMCGNTTIAETADSATHTICIAYTPVPSTITVSKADSGKTLSFVTGVKTSLESTIDKIDSDLLKEVQTAISDAESGKLKQFHIDAWAELWKHGIDIQGRGDVAIAVNASLFAILSSIRADWPHGLAPGGLTNYYNGHSFWDTETWMYPPILLLHDDIAESLLQYRYDRIDGARRKAQSYDPPYEGTMFPWESASTGVETCPLWAPTGLREQHINGDISLAIWQYWLAQKDSAWLSKVGYEMLTGIADFWVSRVTITDNVAHINDIIPPDEYVDNVNDSVYTNYVAQLALKLTVNAAKILNMEPPEVYSDIANKMFIPFDSELGIHPEYVGYSGDVVKQADVVLLHYPLEMSMTEKDQLADLNYYSTRTDSNGPAMTWGMHCIGYLDAKDLVQAEYYLNRSFQDNMQEPLYVWTETPGGNAGNFVTGAGGFLQTILSGYAGMRLQIESEGLSFAPLCMKGSHGMTLRGINYIGAELTLSYSCDDADYADYPTKVAIAVTETTSSINLFVNHLNTSKQLVVGVPVEYELIPDGQSLARFQIYGV